MWGNVCFKMFFPPRAGDWGSCWRVSKGDNLAVSCRGSIFAAMLIAVVIVFIFALPFLYDNSPKFRYYVKFYIYYAYVMVASALFLPVMAFRPKDVVNLILAGRICRVVSRLLGLRWIVRGEALLANDQPCVIVANHQSSLDVLGMFEIWHVMGKVTVVAKKELLYAGPFGLAAWLCGLIFIERKDADKAKTQINEAVKALIPKKIKLWVFPEGTRRNTGTIHPFKKGAFRVALDAQLPILPVVFSQYNFLDHAAKTFQPGNILITALPPIDTTGLKPSDIEALMEKTRDAMLHAFQSSQPDAIS